MPNYEDPEYALNNLSIEFQTFSRKARNLALSNPKIMVKLKTNYQYLDTQVSQLSPTLSSPTRSFTHPATHSTTFPLKHSLTRSPLLYHADH